MKIVGVTIIRNAVKNDYPIVEAITSILPLVDEMIVAIDKAEDETEQLIKDIGSNKLRLVYSQWNMDMRKGGEVLAVETNKALQQVPADADWVFYIQADEVVHEKYHAAILEGAKKYLADKQVDGLLFKYLHFYGTYDYVADSRSWYECETRIIRNDPTIKAYKDAQGFRRGKEKIAVAAIDAYVYHYGWVKSPAQMKIKQKNVSRFWNEDSEERAAFLASTEVFHFDDYDSLAKFTGTHPAVMKKRIEEKNWHLDLDVTRKRLSVKDRFLQWIERTTGKRPFAFRNHRVIRK
jgi:hypothetical protein